METCSGCPYPLTCSRCSRFIRHRNRSICLLMERLGIGPEIVVGEVFCTSCRNWDALAEAIEKGEV